MFESPHKQERKIEEDKKNFLEAVSDIDIQEIKYTATQKDIEAFVSNIENTKIFLLGETHGVKENADVIYTFFKNYGFQNLALEWDKSLESTIEKFLETGEFDFASIQNSPDGRITAGHFALFRKMRDEGLLKKVICFEGGYNYTDWNNRDTRMANNILDELSEYKTLVVAGNLHTKTKSFVKEEKGQQVAYHPMGETIKKEIPHVQEGKIQYLTGDYYNYGTKEFRKVPGDIELPKPSFSKEEDRYIFTVPEAHAAVVPNPSKTL